MFEIYQSDSSGKFRKRRNAKDEKQKTDARFFNIVAHLSTDLRGADPKPFGLEVIGQENL